jgi:hypothetical protein
VATLYIVDGDSSAGSLKPAVPGAEILVWRDALYDGPVPGGLSLGELSRVRARHWNAGRAFAERDRALKRARTFDEVILWFGPTMVCQLSLIQLLDWFSRNPVRLLTLVDDEYAGWLPPNKIAEPLAKRRRVTASIFALARRTWKAFTSPDPSRLKKFVESDSAALPELRPVLQRMLEEYPDATGLSRIERKLLEQFRRPQKAAAGVAAAMRDETFSDTYYFDALDHFIAATNQLICFAEPPPENLRASKLVLTDFGRKVLAGKADAIASNGIDRWIGGVRLQGDHIPRR